MGPGLARLRLLGGTPSAAAPGSAPIGRHAAERGSGLLQRWFQGEKPTPAGPPACLRPWFPVVAPPVGEGKGGRVGGGGRSDADAKVAASGHHFCARKLNPGLKVAAAPLAGCSEAPPPLPIIPNMF